MSHELRTPLNSIIGFSRLVAEAPELQSETRRRAILARDASQTLLTIVNDILDFSRFETEGVTLAPEPSEVNAIVGSVADLFRDECSAKGVHLLLGLPREAIRVLADPMRLRQVLMNLVGNAVKFTRLGSVTISLSSDAQGRLKFAVKDTGIGIPHSRQSAIFERFAQADTSVVRQFGGSGLGLTISKSIIEAMGGEIGVFSTEGRGSTFWFTAARFEAPRLSASGLTDQPEAPTLAANILFVDDNPANCELFKALLETPGLDISCVASGAEAIRSVEHWPYDLVFMDVQMPVMDGLETTQRIRSLGYDKLPVIALTANVMPANVDACLAAGMNGHLAKPFNAEEILAAIRHWVGVVCPDAVVEDRKTAETLVCALGTKKFDRFLETLADQLVAFLPTLNNPHSNAGEIAEAAHSLRGYAGSLGFSELGEILKQLEETCGGKDSTTPLVDVARSAVELTLIDIAARRAA